MATTRAELRPRSSTGTMAAGTGVAWWPIAAGACGLAVVTAVATTFELVPPAVGLAATILALLVLLAERGFERALRAPTPGVAMAGVLGIAWIGLCYLPFHAFLFPGAPLHEPIAIRGDDAPQALQIPTGGRRAVDLLLEAALPPNPNGGPGIPVRYTLTLEDAANTPIVLAGHFEDNLRTRPLGRRGTATVLQTHHTERHLVSNPARGDLTLTHVVLEPAEGALLTVTALAHHLPPTPLLALLGVTFLAAAVVVDTRVVPGSDGTLTFATGGALGTAVVLWTSNVVHPTMSNLIGAIIFGGPIGLGLGALLWAVARRALGHAGR